MSVSKEVSASSSQHQRSRLSSWLHQLKQFFTTQPSPEIATSPVDSRFLQDIFNIKNLILPIPTPKTILYYDELPSHGAPLRKMTVENFAFTFGSVYSEGIWAEPAVCKTMIWDKEALHKRGYVSGISEEQIQQGIKEILAGHDLYRYALTYMGTYIGHGTFAVDFIPKHTVVSIYSGEIKMDQNSHHTNDYKFYESNFYYEAARVRSLASFMQHLPGNAAAFGDKQQAYAVTNVLPEFTAYQGIPLIVIVALRDIHPGEQIGYTYGIHYWTSRELRPELFYHSGEVVPAYEYTPEQIDASYEYLNP
jgi:hypothetical protein